MHVMLIGYDRLQCMFLSCSLHPLQFRLLPQFKQVQLYSSLSSEFFYHFTPFTNFRTCSACSSECVGGCLSELVCNGCAALSMDKTNQCACTGGMIKTTSDTCECDTSSYWDSITSTCELCTDQFSSQCLTCNSATCTGCE